MKYISYFIFSTAAAAFFSAAPLQSAGLQYDITDKTPILNTAISYGFVKIDDVYHYKNADWSQLIGMAKDVSVDEACRIAQSNPEITYFFYIKGKKFMVDHESGDYRVFHHRDAIFFTGEPTWSTSLGAADGYTKCKHSEH